jgi:hypothetical protein
VLASTEGEQDVPIKLIVASEEETRKMGEDREG